MSNETSTSSKDMSGATTTSVKVGVGELKTASAATVDVHHELKDIVVEWKDIVVERNSYAAALKRFLGGSGGASRGSPLWFGLAMALRSPADLTIFALL